MMSKGLITKKCVTTYNFKTTLYSSALVMKLFNKPVLNQNNHCLKRKGSLLLNVSIRI